MTSSSDTNGNRSCFIFYFLSTLHYSVMSWFFQVLRFRNSQNFSNFCTKVRLPRDSVPSNTCDNRCFFCSWSSWNFFFYDLLGHQARQTSTVSSWLHPMGNGQWPALPPQDSTKGQPRSSVSAPVRFRQTPPALREIRKASLSPWLKALVMSCLSLAGVEPVILKEVSPSLAVLVEPFPTFPWTERKSRHGVRRLPNPVPVGLGDYLGCHWLQIIFHKQGRSVTYLTQAHQTR